MSEDQIEKLASAVAEGDAQRVVTCPHCQGQISFVAKEKFAPGHKYSMRITPGNGALFSTKHVGDIIGLTGKLYDAVAADAGLSLRSYIERVEQADDGSLTFHFVTAIKTTKQRKFKPEKNQDQSS